MSLLRLFCRGYALSNKQSPVLVNIPAAMDVLKEEKNPEENEESFRTKSRR